jgi:hypothetical protein
MRKATELIREATELIQTATQLVNAFYALLKVLGALLTALGFGALIKGFRRWRKPKSEVGTSAGASTSVWARVPPRALFVVGGIALVVGAVLLFVGVFGHPAETVSVQNLDALKREAAELSKPVDELQAKSENLKATIEASNTRISELETRAKVLDATVEPNIQIGELEMRARALETTVARVSLLVFTTPALAQDSEPPTPTPAASPTPQPPTTPSPMLASNQIVLLAIATLVFAVVALLTILIYTYVAQKQFCAAAEKLGRAGRAVKLVSVSSIEGAALTAVVEGAPPSKSLTIEGPEAVTVGVQSSEFKATWTDGKPAIGAKWSVEPTSAASYNPVDAESSARIKVIAATVGAFKLTATATYEGTENGEKTVSLRVAALAPETGPVELPFIGRGYGAIVISVILITAVVILGITNVLSGQGVAALIGGLLGYIFGVGVTSNANRKPTNEE